MPAIALADSSVLLAAMRSEGEPQHEPAAAIVRAAGEGTIELRIIDLTLYEIGNVMVRAWKLSPRVQERNVREIVAVCGEPLAPTLDDHASARAIATEHGITVYDAMYVAIARRIGATLISADERDLAARALALLPAAAAEQLLEA